MTMNQLMRTHRLLLAQESAPLMSQLHIRYSLVCVAEQGRRFLWTLVFRFLPSCKIILQQPIWKQIWWCNFTLFRPFAGSLETQLKYCKFHQKISKNCRHHLWLHIQLDCFFFSIQNLLKENMSRSRTKPTKWNVRPSKIQIRPNMHPVWSESSLFARRWVKAQLRFGLILGVGRFSHKGESFRPWVVSALERFGPISVGRIIRCKDRVGLWYKWKGKICLEKVRYTTVGVGRLFYVGVKQGRHHTKVTYSTLPWAPSWGQLCWVG